VPSKGKKNKKKEEEEEEEEKKKKKKKKKKTWELGEKRFVSGQGLRTPLCVLITVKITWAKGGHFG